MSLIETVFISVITTIAMASIGFFFYYLRIRMKEKSESKAEPEKNKRESFKKLLDQHSKILLGKHHDANWEQDFSDMCKSILLWGSDKILKEYGIYVQKHDTTIEPILEHEIHFAKAILVLERSWDIKTIGRKLRQNKLFLYLEVVLKGISDKKSFSLLNKK